MVYIICLIALVFLTIALFIGDVCINCPTSVSYTPCKCDHFYDQIVCGGTQDIDLVNVFQRLGNSLNKSEKHFTSFWLNNTAITELRENTFKDITFDRIYIGFCNKLKTVQKNTFNGTEKVTKFVEFESNPSLQTSDDLIFKVLAKFDSIQQINLLNNNISEIPENAFKSENGNQDSLLQMWLTGRKFNKI